MQSFFKKYNEERLREISKFQNHFFNLQNNSQIMKFVPDPPNIYTCRN